MYLYNTYYLYIFNLIIMNLSKYADLSWLSFEELVLIHYLFVCLQIDSTSILFCLFADPHFDWPFWECSFGFFRRICLFFSVPSSLIQLINSIYPRKCFSWGWIVTCWVIVISIVMPSLFSFLTWIYNYHNDHVGFANLF